MIFIISFCFFRGKWFSFTYCVMCSKRGAFPLETLSKSHLDLEKTWEVRATSFSLDSAHLVAPRGPRQTLPALASVSQPFLSAGGGPAPARPSLDLSSEGHSYDPRAVCRGQARCLVGRDRHLLGCHRLGGLPPTLGGPLQSILL